MSADEATEAHYPLLTEVTNEPEVSDVSPSDLERLHSKWPDLSMIIINQCGTGPGSLETDNHLQIIVDIRNAWV